MINNQTKNKKNYKKKKKKKKMLESFDIKFFFRLNKNTSDWLCKALPFLCCFWSRGYKTFFMLNSTEHEIFPAHKC